MNIQEVLKLKNGTIVQNETTKKRYMVYDYFYRGNKYLVKYENKNHSSHTIKPGEIKELKEIIVPINEALIMAEYTVCMDFKEKDNFIYESEDGKLYKGMVLKVNDYSYEAIIVEEEIIKQITINKSNIWRMRKIN